MVAEPQFLHTCAPMTRTTHNSAALNQNPQIFHTYQPPTPYASYLPYPSSMHFQDQQVHHPSYRQSWNHDPSCNQPGNQAILQDWARLSEDDARIGASLHQPQQHMEARCDGDHEFLKPLKSVLELVRSQNSQSLHPLNNQPVMQEPSYPHLYSSAMVTDPSTITFNHHPVQSPHLYHAISSSDLLSSSMPLANLNIPQPINHSSLPSPQPRQQQIDEYRGEYRSRFDDIKRVLGIPLQQETSSPYLNGSGSESSKEMYKVESGDQQRTSLVALVTLKSESSLQGFSSLSLISTVSSTCAKPQNQNHSLRGLFQSLSPTQQGLALNVNFSVATSHVSIKIRTYLQNQRYYVYGLAKEVTRNHELADRDENNLKRANYFKDHYNHGIQVRNLPWWQDNKSKMCYLPMKLYVICEGHEFLEKLSPTSKVMAILVAKSQKKGEKARKVKTELKEKYKDKSSRSVTYSKAEDSCYSIPDLFQLNSIQQWHIAWSPSTAHLSIQYDASFLIPCGQGISKGGVLSHDNSSGDRQGEHLGREEDSGERSGEEMTEERGDGPEVAVESNGLGPGSHVEKLGQRHLNMGQSGRTLDRQAGK